MSYRDHECCSREQHLRQLMYKRYRRTAVKSNWVNSESETREATHTSVSNVLPNTVPSRRQTSPSTVAHEGSRQNMLISSSAWNHSFQVILACRVACTLLISYKIIFPGLIMSVDKGVHRYCRLTTMIHFRPLTPRTHTTLCPTRVSKTYKIRTMLQVHRDRTSSFLATET